MSSCTKAESVRADLLFEIYDLKNGFVSLYSVLPKFVFFFSLPFTEKCFCSDLYSLFLLSNISVKIEGIVLKLLRWPYNYIELPSAVIFV